MEKKKKKKKILGAVETVFIDDESYEARIDSGAAKSSVCTTILESLEDIETIKQVVIKSANGEEVRDVVRLKFKLKGRKMRARFTVADRTSMQYPILIGRNVLKNKFLIDPAK